MKSLNIYIKYGIPGIIIGGVITTGLQLVIAWTGPSANPPNNNVDAPINVSSNPQTKFGSLTIAPSASLLSPILYDIDDTAYKVDPAGTSVLNTQYNYGYIETASSNWGLLTRGVNGVDNWGPLSKQQAEGSIYTNDVYSRAAQRWMSQIADQTDTLTSQTNSLASQVSGLAGQVSSLASSSGAPCVGTFYYTHTVNLQHSQSALVTNTFTGSKDLMQCFNGSLNFIVPGLLDGGAGGGTGSGGD